MNKKYPIWGNTIPFNTGEDKIDYMSVDSKNKGLVGVVKFIKEVKSQKLTAQGKTALDSYTFFRYMKKGLCSEKMNDVPTLTAFLAEGSDSAVIVVPGGGYAAGNISDLPYPEDDEEATLTAKKLNQMGINAFVLGYRYNPYRMPAPLADMQRAVRWLKYNSETFGIHPDKIGLLGFSAGGYEVAGFINLLRGEDILPKDYKRDSIDTVDDNVNHVSLFYPLLDFSKNQNILYTCFHEADFLGQEDQFFARYDLTKNLHSSDLPQFVAHGTKDHLVDYTISKCYCQLLEQSGGTCIYQEVKGADHCFTHQKKFAFAFEEYLSFAKDCFRKEEAKL